jgi:nickel transport protein
MLIAGLPTSAFSHKLSVFAWVEGDRVYVEGKLGGGKRPKRGKVLVYNGKNRLLLQTKIREDGTASFPLPDWQTGLKIIMDIGDGHKSYWILTPLDIKEQREESSKEK